jgi:allantoinase
VEVRDFGALVILPGVVDSHVHVNEPGRGTFVFVLVTLTWPVDWEGFHSATRAAAAGGVTTIVDMPLNSVPMTVTVDALQEKVKAMEEKLWVDVGLLGGIIPGNEKEIGPLIDAGVLGFKCFMCDSGIPEFPPVNEQQITIAMNEISKKVC